MLSSLIFEDIREISREYVHTSECRCNERLKAKAEGSTRLTSRGTRTPKDRDDVNLVDERFASVMGECVIFKL